MNMTKTSCRLGRQYTLKSNNYQFWSEGNLRGLANHPPNVVPLASFSWFRERILLMAWRLALHQSLIPGSERIYPGDTAPSRLPSPSPSATMRLPSNREPIVSFLSHGGRGQERGEPSGSLLPPPRCVRSRHLGFRNQPSLENAVPRPAVSGCHGDRGVVPCLREREKLNLETSHGSS